MVRLGGGFRRSRLEANPRRRSKPLEKSEQEKQWLSQVPPGSSSAARLERQKFKAAPKPKELPPGFIYAKAAVPGDKIIAEDDFGDIILQVVPTSPFIKPDTIDSAIELLRDYSYHNSVVGVCKERFYFWEDGKPDYYINGKIPNSQELPESVFETTGLYVNRTKFVLEKSCRIDVNTCHPIFLSKIESIDINTKEDFEFAQIIWRGLYS